MLELLRHAVQEVSANMASKINFEKQKMKPKFADAVAQSLQHLRARPRVLPQVRDLPHMLQEHGLAGAHPRRAQGQLVGLERERSKMTMTDPIADMLTRIRNAVRNQ